MNYYIDFDHTLFNTKALVKAMLTKIAEYIASKTNEDYSLYMDELKGKFNRKNIYNIYELIKYFSEKYNLNCEEVTKAVNRRVFKSQEFLYEDAEPFLKKLKETGKEIYLLTYEGEDINYQTIKVYGSGIIKYFDGIIVTKTKKYKLDLIYENGIFIDDKPSECEGYYESKAGKVIRIRRKQDTYSDIDMDNKQIEEYESLLDIKL